jgi:integrase
MSSYLLQSRADSTVTKYKNSYNQFQRYCQENDFNPMPAQPICVAMYLTHLLDTGKSDNVVTAAFYGIKWAHNLNDENDPTESKIVKTLHDTAKRIASKPVNKKDVVSSEMLQTLCTFFAESSDVVDVRDLCMIMLGYSGFLRFNEISNLHCNDIEFKTDHLVLKIRKSKTDIYRQGKEVLISKGSSVACPYSLLKRYMLISGLENHTEEFLFKPAYRSKGKASLIKKNKKLSYTRAKECIVKKLTAVAPDLKLGTHTLRASGATTAANTPGVNDRCLKRHGRWKSDQAKDGYVDDSLEKRLFITKSLNL